VTEPTPITKKRRYTKRQKTTVVIAAEMSSVAAAAEASGIPESTLRQWVNSPAYAELRAKTREDLAEESSVLAHETLGHIRAKLDQFEPRDLTILYGVLVEKGQLLAGGATGRIETRRLLDDFDDHETDAMREWLRDIARQRLHADD
jgi:hypothetical protein